MTQLTVRSIARALIFGVFGATMFAAAAFVIERGTIATTWRESLMVGCVVLLATVFGTSDGRASRRTVAVTVAIWVIALAIPVTMLLLSQ